MKITGRPGWDKECRITEPTAEAVALAKTLGDRLHRTERDGTIVVDMRASYKFNALLNLKPAAQPQTPRRTWTEADEARLTEARQRLAADPKAPFAFEDVADLEARKHHLTAPLPVLPTDEQVAAMAHVMSEAYDNE